MTMEFLFRKFRLGRDVRGREVGGQGGGGHLHDPGLQQSPSVQAGPRQSQQ